MKAIYPLSIIFLHFAFLPLAGQAFSDTTSVRPISESRLRLTPWNTAALGTGMVFSAIALDLGVEAYYRRYQEEKNGALAAHWRTRTKQCELGRNITMGLGLTSLAASAVLAHREKGRGKEPQGKSLPTPVPALGWCQGQVTLALRGRF
jgi:hypothetical protein